MTARFGIALTALLLGAAPTAAAHARGARPAPRVLELRLEPGHAALSVSEAVDEKAVRAARRSAGLLPAGALDAEQRQAVADLLGRGAWAGVVLSAEGSALTLVFERATMSEGRVTVRLSAELPAPGPEGLRLSLQDSAARKRGSRLSVEAERLRMDGPEEAELGRREIWSARLFGDLP